MHHGTRLLAALAFAAVCFSPARAEDAGRTKARILYDFEDSSDLKKLQKNAENVTLTAAEDVGVTHGARCARLTAAKGAEYAVVSLDADAIQGWGDYDYFAVDVTLEDDHSYALVLELWDGASKNYATRCTFEGVTTRPGRQTLLYPIKHARRNAKEGLEWGELEDKDKMDRDALTQVKLFLNPLKDRDAVLWIDSVRLMQEDAATPKLTVPLPAGAIAYKFGGAGVGAPGFKLVTPETGTPAAGFVDAKGLTAGGEGWPDGLAGTFVSPPEDGGLTFRARVPNGDYRVWLCAGPVIRSQYAPRHFLLRANGEILADDLPAPIQYYSTKYLYRFLNTHYSEKPHALWTNYIDRMYPVHTPTVKVTDGTFTLEAANYFVSAVVLVPASAKGDFDKFAETARKLRIEAFEKTLRPLPGKKTQPQPGDGDYYIFEPDVVTEVWPWTGPTAAERQRRKRESLHAAGAPGQTVTLRLAVVPFTDLGRCEVSVGYGGAELRPPEWGDAVSFQAYRYDGDNLSEMALYPAKSWEFERGVTQCFWLTLNIPKNKKPGTYGYQVSFRPEKGEAADIYLQLEVYPFTPEPVLPVSFGMYYNPREEAGLDPEVQRRLVKEQIQWMRKIGFTSVQVRAAEVAGVGRGGAVRLQIDPTLYDLAREAGMGRDPKQYLMGEALSVGRGVGKHLIGEDGGLKIDRDPGLELRQPGFREAFLDAMRQDRDFIRKTGLPVALEIADEPREAPNPWNRNLADSIAYGDLLHEAGVTSFITPMSDTGSGKDYTELVDHADVISTHAWKGSAGLIRKTHEKGKTLWLYNTGMDRFSWGFYNWRARSEGRWEWHFCAPEDAARGGYPGREWYNPFTGVHGFAPYAPPADHPGGMLFQSKFLDVMEGINDYAYLVTLNKTIRAAGGDDRRAAAVKEARAFLAALDRAIPELPDAKGLLNEGDGALVGMGVDDDARLQAPRWRGAVARLLKALRE